MSSSTDAVVPPATESFRGPLASIFERQAGVAPGALADALPSLLRHPAEALPVPPASDRSAWPRAADAATAAAILERAEADLGLPWPQPRAHDAARVHSDGDRDVWEQAAYARQRRLSRATVAAALTDHDKWYAEVLDGVWLLCEQSSWCWPAHDDVFRQRGWVLGDIDAPYLDLGAGEVVGQLAWLDHLVGDGLERRYPGVRARIRREARVRVIEPFIRRRDWHWLGLDGDVHNWNPWIHGNVLVAALALMEADDPARSEVIALVIEGIDRYVAVLPQDGAIDEGYAYWWNGACRALEALDILSHATGNRLDAFDVPALRATVAFPHRMHLGGPWYLNLADGPARPPAAQPWHALHRAARRVGDTDAAAHAAAHREGSAAVETDGLGRLLRGMTDAAWVDTPRGASPLPRDSWLPSTQVLIARPAAGTAAGLTLAVKGGHNGEHHNHNDVGSFVIASDGVPVIVDAGRPTYTAQTFGPDRYAIWTMQSGWHNVPVIGGREQVPGSAHAARDIAVEISDAGSSLSLDLAGAYEGVTSWRRTARLERTGQITIDDTWDADAPAGETSVRLLIAGEVEIEGDSAVVTPLEGARPVRVRWSPAASARLVVRELDDPMLSTVWGERLTRLDLIAADVERLSATVELVKTTDGDPR
ncbi:heparinase II/III domain-containing protein [Microbacterium sp. P5_E9]